MLIKINNSICITETIIRIQGCSFERKVQVFVNVYTVFFKDYNHGIWSQSSPKFWSLSIFLGRKKPTMVWRLDLFLSSGDAGVSLIKEAQCA